MPAMETEKKQRCCQIYNRQNDGIITKVDRRALAGHPQRGTDLKTNSTQIKVSSTNRWSGLFKMFLYIIPRTAGNGRERPRMAETNKLKLNDDKTESLLIASNRTHFPNPPPISIPFPPRQKILVLHFPATCLWRSM